MKPVKVTYNAKPKRSEQLNVSSYEDLINQIYQIFNIQNGKITFMKPRLKDQASFDKQVKQNMQILIVGALKKQKSAEDIQKQKKQQEELQKIREQLKLNPHERIVKKLKEKGIKERGIQYLNPQTNMPEDLGIQYALAPLYLLKYSSQFRIYCKKYRCMTKNPDGLIIEELGKMFTIMDKSQTVICPLEWISAFICYCSDDIEYPYPTYGVDYFITRLFATIKTAFEVQLQKKEEQPNSRIDCGTKVFGIQVLTKRADITRLDQQDIQGQKQIDKKAVKYFMECDLGSPHLDSYFLGLKERMAQKKLWRNFYAFDIQYRQKIEYIERLPKYLLIHCSRWGYPEYREQWQEVQFNEGKKAYHEIKINRILDLYDLCDANLKDKLDQGRYERDQMFYPYHMDERFPSFCQNIKYCDKLNQYEQRYFFLDDILFNRDIYHQFWFEPIKNSKPTGEYRIMGVVFHKGDYYHRPNSEHNHDCKGDYMTVLYKRGREWIKYHRAEVTVVDIEEACNFDYWGGKQGNWTPVFFLYRQIYMRNIQVEPPSQSRRDRRDRTRRRH